jgi:hypothetical protein
MITYIYVNMIILTTEVLKSPGSSVYVYNILFEKKKALCILHLLHNKKIEGIIS